MVGIEQIIGLHAPCLEFEKLLVVLEWKNLLICIIQYLSSQL